MGRDRAASVDGQRGAARPKVEKMRFEPWAGAGVTRPQRRRDDTPAFVTLCNICKCTPVAQAERRAQCGCAISSTNSHKLCESTECRMTTINFPLQAARIPSLTPGKVRMKRWFLGRTTRITGVQRCRSRPSRAGKLSARRRRQRPPRHRPAGPRPCGLSPRRNFAVNRGEGAAVPFRRTWPTRAVFRPVGRAAFCD